MSIRHLNEQKNIPSDDQDAVPKTLEDLKGLPDPVPGFKVGNTREKASRNTAKAIRLR